MYFIHYTGTKQTAREKRMHSSALELHKEKVEKNVFQCTELHKEKVKKNVLQCTGVTQGKVGENVLHFTGAA